MTSPELRRSLGQSRVAILGYFFVLGVATATWSARLPAIKESLRLTDGRLGLRVIEIIEAATSSMKARGETIHLPRSERTL